MFSITDAAFATSGMSHEYLGGETTCYNLQESYSTTTDSGYGLLIDTSTNIYISEGQELNSILMLNKVCVWLPEREIREVRTH